MSTPKKNNKTFNYTSPYSKPPAQYPSQNEDYISLDMGGRSEPDLKPGRDLFGNNNHYKNNQRRGNHQNYFGNTAYSNNYSNNRCMTPRKNNDDTYRYTNVGIL